MKQWEPARQYSSWWTSRTVSCANSPADIAPELSDLAEKATAIVDKRCTAGAHVHDAGLLVTQRFIGEGQLIDIADIPRDLLDTP